jgi:hypothetical protein
MHTVPIKPARANGLTSAAVIAWSVLLFAGFAAVARWEHRPGAWKAQPDDWRRARGSRGR